VATLASSLVPGVARPRPQVDEQPDEQPDEPTTPRSAPQPPAIGRRALLAGLGLGGLVLVGWRDAAASRATGTHVALAGRMRAGDAASRRSPPRRTCRARCPA
jgi:hypothetical protein